MSAFQSVSGLIGTQNQNTNNSAKGIVASSSTGYSTKSDDTGHSAEVEYIREHGFTAYVKEIEEQKIKEMRDKILQSMGLDEEKLAAMPADQRAAIETAITERIQQQLNVGTIANQSDEDDDKSGMKKQDQNLAQMSFDPKMYAVLTMMQEQDQRSAAQMENQPVDANKPALKTGTW
ncbi:hypothetical protein [Thalassospira sp. MCCC 1A01428]|uniref:hypothetical protein n=1 Tax=unclassified Thalassospira TaxID=2648997 RepID=UPI00111C5110|nr:hypothetical protein [Thalassospira sp. MCCC 1A01428]